MKKFFAFVISASLFFSCVNKKNKGKPPAPGPDTQIAGNYKVTSLEFDGKNVPLNDAEMTFELDRISADVVTGKMTVVLGEESVPDEKLCNVHFANAGYTGFDLYDQSGKIGHVDEINRLRISVVFDDKKVEILATKE